MLSYQAGFLGRQFGDGIDSVLQRLQRVGDLDTILSQMTVAVDQLSRGMQGGAGGLREIGSGAADMRAGMDGMRDNVTTMSAYLAPLRTFVDTTPDCRGNAICSLVSRVVEPVDSVVHSSGELSQGATKLTSGSSTATTAFAGLPQTLESMREVLGQAKAATRDLRGVADSISPQVRQLSDYLQQLDAGFRGSAVGGFYLPGRALSDPRYRQALNNLVSRDGRATYLVVYGDGQEWGGDGAQRARQIQTAVAEATKEGTLTPVSVDVAGVGPATRDLQGLVHGDIVLLVAAGSTVLSIEQVGMTVGIGLLLDTLIVRTFLMPSLVALLGR